MSCASIHIDYNRSADMAEQNDRPTPPKQSPEDPNMADQRLTEEQKQSLTNEPKAPENKGGKLPDPKDVGESG
jgi:hypothetical protein